MDQVKLQNRSESIDFLRGISILLVIILHFLMFDFGFLQSLSHLWPLYQVSVNGYYGVTAFFVISGYLITTRTFLRYGELKNISPAEFYRFRLGRIIPGLVLLLTIVFVGSNLGIKFFPNVRTAPPWWVSVGATFTCTYNLLIAKYGFYNYTLSILWSLSVEEAFYLVFPLYCLIFRKKWFFLGGCVLLLAVGPWYRHLHLNDHNDGYRLYGYLACFDSIAAGCITAFLGRAVKGAPWAARVRPLFWGVFLFAILGKEIWFNIVWGPSLITVGTAGLLLTSAHSESRGWLRRCRALFCISGKYSYEMYLLHMIVFIFMSQLILEQDVPVPLKGPWFLVLVVFSVLLSAAFSRWYTEPLNRFIRRTRASSN